MFQLYKCEFYRKLLVPYLEGALSLNAHFLVASLEKHLDTCENCRFELAKIRSAHQLFSGRDLDFHSSNSPSKSSVARKVKSKIEFFESAKLTNNRIFKRFALYTACVSAAVLFLIYITFGNSIFKDFNKNNPGAVAADAMRLNSNGASQPIPSPTIQALLGLNSKHSAHGTSTASVLR